MKKTVAIFILSCLLSLVIGYEIGYNSWIMEDDYPSPQQEKTIVILEA